MTNIIFPPLYCNIVLISTQFVLNQEFVWITMDFAHNKFETFSYKKCISRAVAIKSLTYTLKIVRCTLQFVTRITRISFKFVSASYISVQSKIQKYALSIFSNAFVSTLGKRKYDSKNCIFRRV